MAKIIKKIDEFLNEKILNERLEEIVSERFARYSKYIIQDRALPDARDGLKPVQRRILYGMQQMGVLHNKSYKKSARIVGDVMGKYHPHGDSSIYEAMVRMSQDFKMRELLIDMHGNNGSIDGDSAAAMRYTETRLSLAAEYLLKDIDKKTVPFVPNFDDEELEPIVLPAKFPNLLVNGAMGISAGYATKIPPHNLREVIEATIAYIENNKITSEELRSYIKGPDFPTGGIVQGAEGIKVALDTGAGKVIVRARTIIEEMDKNQERIIVTEIPYEVNKADLVRSIDMIRIDKKLEDILEVRDETDQEGLRIAIDIKKGADAQFCLNYLFKNTDLQVSYNYNMVAILNNRPVQVGILPILKTYVEHQKDVITNRSNFEHEKASKRKHIVEGLMKMVSVVTEVIETIRKSLNKADAKINIQDRFGFTELQAEAIVMLQLYRLSNTDIVALMNENEALEKVLIDLNKILSSERVLLNVIKKELKEVSEVLGDDRKTSIESEIENIKIDQTQLISDEKVVIGITKEGYVKRSNIRSYATSQAIGLKENDCFLFEKEVQTLDTLLIFTSLGNYIFLPVYKIEDQKWKDLGIYINNIVPIKKEEKIVSVMLVKTFNTNQNLLLSSKSGMMKQVRLQDLEVSRYNKPIRVMKIDASDELVNVDINQKANILAITKNGYALRFMTDELPVYGLTASGVKGISLSEDDELVSSIYVKETDEFVMLTIRGHIIKDVVSEIKLYGRYRKGISVVEKQKNHPHYIVSFDRLTKEQEKEKAVVTIITNSTAVKLSTDDLKYSYNKFGKRIVDIDKIGAPEHIIITESLLEEILDDTKSNNNQTKKIDDKDKKDVNKTETFEEFKVKSMIEKDDKKEKIKLTKLDLFDDFD